MAANADEQKKQIAVVVVVAVILLFVFKGVIFKSKTGKDNVRGDGGGAVAGGGGGPGEQPLAAPAVTPTMIPMLTPEINKKIKERKGSSDAAYSKEKLEVGINPFIPLGVDTDKLDAQAAAAPTGGPTGSGRKKQSFGKKLTFWGAFMPGPEEPKRVIIEVGGDPQPWTGTVGETIDGTPFKVDSLINGDQEVVLVNPTNPQEKPVHLQFEGSKDDTGGRSNDKDVDELFGGGGAAGGKKPEGAKAPAGKSSLEPAFDR